MTVLLPHSLNITTLLLLIFHHSILHSSSILSQRNYSNQDVLYQSLETFAFNQILATRRPSFYETRINVKYDTDIQQRLQGRKLNKKNYRNLRLQFAITEISSTQYTSTYRGQRIINAVIDEVLPLVTNFFNDILTVLPTTSPLTIPSNICYDLFSVPYEWTNYGIDNTDIVVILSSLSNIGGAEICSNDIKSLTNTLMASSPCALDTKNRPLVGFVNICWTTILNKYVTSEEILKLVYDTIIHEVIHILGFNSEMFRFFIDPYTGESLTPRYENEEYYLEDYYQETIQPCNNTVLYKEIKSTDNNMRSHYELVTPTVRQVARNQFNCQSLTGVKLENQPTGNEISIGSHFDERIAFNDIMSAIYDDDSMYITPLTLSVLEDSGFYRPKYELSNNGPFGLGTSCDFVTESCVHKDGSIPQYSRGYFCNDTFTSIYTLWNCGPNHAYRSTCDLQANIFPFISYFSDDTSLGPLFIHADYCPLNIQNETDCYDTYSIPISNQEVFGNDSKCIRVKKNNKPSSMCMRSICHHNNQTLSIILKEDLVVTCDKDFLVLKVNIHGSEMQIECPRLSAICPNIFCPAMCSGKGICHWEYERPICECFDPSDETDGCYESLPLSPNPCPCGVDNCHINPELVKPKEDARSRKFSFGNGSTDGPLLCSLTNVYIFFIFWLLFFSLDINGVIIMFHTRT